MTSLSSDLILVIIVAFAGGMLARAFKQPLAVGYLAAGIMLGPHISAVKITNTGNISLIADIGAAMLLFSLGMELSLKDLRKIWQVAFIGTAAQVFASLLVGYFFALQFGATEVASVWIGAAFVSSSSAMVLRMLVSRNLRKTLSGSIMLGVSIVQDLLMIPVFIFALGISIDGFSARAILLPFFSFAFLLSVMAFLAVRIIPFALHQVARLGSQELFLLATISMGLGIGYLANLFGLSVAFGAFIAGLVLSESDFGQKTLSEMVPLRNVLGMIFFASIGMLFDPGFVFEHFQIVVTVLLMVFLIKGFLLAGISIWFGYQRIVPIAMFLGMLPVSEMAFIFAREALAINAIDMNLYSLILNVVILSMFIGPLVASFSGPIYKAFRLIKPEEVPEMKNFLEHGFLKGHLVIAGAEDYAISLARIFERKKLDCIVIEPVYMSFLKLQQEKVRAIFGEPDRSGILKAADIEGSVLLMVFDSIFFSSEIVLNKALEINPELEVFLFTSNKNEIDHWKNHKNIKVSIIEEQVSERVAQLVCKKMENRMDKKVLEQLSQG